MRGDSLGSKFSLFSPDSHRGRLSRRWYSCSSGLIIPSGNASAGRFLSCSSSFSYFSSCVMLLETPVFIFVGVVAAK